MCRVNQPPQRARRRCFRKRTCSAAGISMTIREGTADTANGSERWHFLREQKPHPLCHASRAHCPILYVERFRQFLMAAPMLVLVVFAQTSRLDGDSHYTVAY